MMEALLEEDVRPTGYGAMRPATTIHGYPGGRIGPGMALARAGGAYSEQPLLPGGAVEPGFAALMPAVYPGYPPDEAMFLQARGLTVADACIQARQQLCDLSSSWCNATCDQITAHIQQDPTIFVCPNPIRCVLAPGTCTTAQCTPPPPPPCDATHPCTPPLVCVSGQCVQPTPGPTDMTLYYVAGGVVVLAFLALLISGGGRRPVSAPAGR